MPSALGSHVSRWLGTLSLEPWGMPPAAVLVVRRLGDPAPGRIAAHPAAARASSDWERAARTALTECYRNAARPASGLWNTTQAFLPPASQ